MFQKFLKLFRNNILPVLIYGLIKGIGWSMRIRILGAENVRDYWKRNKPFILAFWHGRQLMIPLVYEGKKVHILISQHRDGELISRAMKYFGFETVRGSSTRGGMAGLKGMVRAVQSGSDLAITPDGPKGPRHGVHGGVLEMAKLIQIPIFPVTFNASKKKFLLLGMVF